MSQDSLKVKLLLICFWHLGFEVLGVCLHALLAVCRTRGWLSFARSSLDVAKKIKG